MKIDNLYQHADGGFYCLLSNDAPMKHPDSEDWIKGVIYTGTDGQMRSTTLARWKVRFKKVAEYAENDETVLNMIRRCNPGDSELDFLRVFESWHESEMGITGHMLELAVGAAMVKMAAAMNWNLEDRLDMKEGFALTITTADLQRVVQNYEIERVPEAHGFKFVMRKSFPNET